MQAEAASPELLGRLLAELAVLPDDSSSVDAILRQIAELAATHIDAVDYASVTVQRDGRHTTVAMTSELALAVDEAQYADNSGPCIDATAGSPVSVAEMATVMEWPNFRDAALAMGLRSSLSIPLFTASGTPTIALNLYAHGPDALTGLTEALLPVYHGELDPASGERHGGRDLGPASRELVAGLTHALKLRDVMQRAIGLMMTRDGVDARTAYVLLRAEAADRGHSIYEHAQGLTGAAT